MNEPIHCSFCGKSRKEVRRLIAGPFVYICNECIAISVQVLNDEEEREKKTKQKAKKVADGIITNMLKRNK